jgi:hypothetical protein
MIPVDSVQLIRLTLESLMAGETEVKGAWLAVVRLLIRSNFTAIANEATWVWCVASNSCLSWSKEAWVVVNSMSDIGTHNLRSVSLSQLLRLVYVHILFELLGKFHHFDFFLLLLKSGLTDYFMFQLLFLELFNHSLQRNDTVMILLLMIEDFRVTCLTHFIAERALRLMLIQFRSE